jgi:hypothetical protein
VDRGTRGGDLERLLDALPDSGLDRSGPIAYGQPEPLPAVSPLAQLALPNAEYGIDDLTVDEVAHPRAITIAGVTGGACDVGDVLAQQPLLAQ